MKKLVLAGLLTSLVATAAWAQSLNTTTVSNGTITATGVFQSILAASNSRKSCTFQNQGTNVMYLYFGPTASATAAKSLQVQAGQVAYCAVFGVALEDNVALTGTIGDPFVIYSQGQ